MSARMAQALAEKARSALEDGELEGAETQAAHALRMDADNENAQEVLRHAGALRDAGFRVEDDGGDIGEAPTMAPARPW